MKSSNLFKWISTKLLGETPNFASMEEWRDIDIREKSMPMRYFILRTVPCWISVKHMQLNDFRYWFKYRLQNKHKYHLVNTGLTPNYYEIDKRMLHANFNLLKNFVEDELANLQYWNRDKNDPNWIFDNKLAGLEHLDWQISLIHDESAGIAKDHKLYGKATPQAINATETKKLYLWWVNDRPNRKDPWGSIELDHKPSKSMYDAFTGTDEEKAARIVRGKKRMAMEEKYNSEDDEMLIRLIRVRQDLWS